MARSFKCFLLLGALLGMPLSCLGKLRVLVTTTMIADMVAFVGGDLVDVHTLMGAGVDPHMYRPTAWDAIQVREADVIFYNGLHLEGRMQVLFTSITKQGRSIYALSEGINTHELMYPSHLEGMPDPHVWFDPLLWKQGVAIVVKGLARHLPKHIEEIRQRGNVYEKNLEKINAWAEITLNNIPLNKRLLITSHDAFHYFGRAFNFRVEGVQGISTLTEAGLADVVSIVDLIKKNNIPAIFVETSVSPAVIERISRDAQVAIGGALFSDAMGEPGYIKDPELQEGYDPSTYEGMLKHNILTILRGLKMPDLRDNDDTSNEE